MIPANSMYVVQLRATWWRTVPFIFGVSLISAMLISASVGWRMFPRLVLCELIVCGVIGSFFWLAGPFIRYNSDRLKPVPRWCFRILCWAIVLNVGALIGLAILRDCA